MFVVYVCSSASTSHHDFSPGVPSVNKRPEQEQVFICPTTSHIRSVQPGDYAVTSTVHRTEHPRVHHAPANDALLGRSTQYNRDGQNPIAHRAYDSQHLTYTESEHLRHQSIGYRDSYADNQHQPRPQSAVLATQV